MIKARISPSSPLPDGRPSTVPPSIQTAFTTDRAASSSSPVMTSRASRGTATASATVASSDTSNVACGAIDRVPGEDAAQTEWRAWPPRRR